MLVLSIYPPVEYFYIPLAKKILDEAQGHFFWMRRLSRSTRLGIQHGTSWGGGIILEIENISWADALMKDRALETQIPQYCKGVGTQNVISSRDNYLPEC